MPVWGHENPKRKMNIVIITGGYLHKMVRIFMCHESYIMTVCSHKDRDGLDLKAFS